MEPFALNRMLVLKNGCRNCSRRRGRKRVSPAFDTRVHGKTLARILVSQNACACLVYPLVPASVIEVPVRVDELLDGIRIDAGQSRSNVRPSRDDFGIDKKLSVRPRKNGDVSTGTKQNADIAPKRLHRHLGGGGCFQGHVNQALLGKRAEAGRDTRPQPQLHSRSETDAVKLRWPLCRSSIRS